MKDEGFSEWFSEWMFKLMFKEYMIYIVYIENEWDYKELKHKSMYKDE